MYHLWFQCVVAATISRSSLSQRFRCPTSVSSSTSLSRALSLSSLSREPATSVHPSLSSRDVVREGSDWWLCASSSAKLRSCTSKQKAAAKRSLSFRSSNEFEPKVVRARTERQASRSETLLKSAALLALAPRPLRAIGETEQSHARRSRRLPPARVENGTLCRFQIGGQNEVGDRRAWRGRFFLKGFLYSQRNHAESLIAN